MPKRFTNPGYIRDLLHERASNPGIGVGGYSRQKPVPPDPKKQINYSQQRPVSFSASMQKINDDLTKFADILGTAPVTFRDPMFDSPEVQDIGKGTHPVVGYRDFNYVLDADQRIYLASRNGVCWPRYQAFFATCTLKTNVYDHDSPDVNCTCGIYAFDNLKHDDLKTECPIYGEVNLWGDVLLCETGFRAELAYPKTLFVVDNGTRIAKRIRNLLEECYGVPTYLVDKKNKPIEEVLEREISKLMRGSKK